VNERKWKWKWILHSRSILLKIGELFFAFVPTVGYISVWDFGAPASALGHFVIRNWGYQLGIMISVDDSYGYGYAMSLMRAMISER
jgi:hypothetical protein